VIDAPESRFVPWQPRMSVPGSAAVNPLLPLVARAAIRSFRPSLRSSSHRYWLPSPQLRAAASGTEGPSALGVAPNGASTL